MSAANFRFACARVRVCELSSAKYERRRRRFIANFRTSARRAGCLGEADGVEEVEEEDTRCRAANAENNVTIMNTGILSVAFSINPVLPFGRAGVPVNKFRCAPDRAPHREFCRNAFPFDCSRG